MSHELSMKKHMGLQFQRSLNKVSLSINYLREEAMRLNAPSRISWIVSLILGLLSLLSYFVAIPFVTVNLFWFMGAGWLLLILATFMRGL